MTLRRARAFWRAAEGLAVTYVLLPQVVEKPKSCQVRSLILWWYPCVCTHFLQSGTQLLGEAQKAYDLNVELLEVHFCCLHAGCAGVHRLFAKSSKGYFDWGRE